MSTPTRDPAPSAPHAPIPAAAPEPVPDERSAAPLARRRSAGWAASPAIGLRELLAVCAAGIALSLIATWPLAFHLGSRISPDLGDPIRTAWQVAWIGHAMVHDPLHLFDSNAFYPQHLSLAFSDSLLGYGPAGLFGSGTVAALVRYNLIFLFIWALCFVGAYLLARELGLRHLGAGIAGVAFAYAPYRATEAGHFQVISSGGIPLALFLLIRGYRRRSGALVLAGWLVSAWQLSLGWTLALQYGYLLALLAVIVAWHWWRRLRAARAASHSSPAAGAGESGAWRSPAHSASRPWQAPARRLAALTGVGLAICAAVAVYQGIPYLKVANAHGTASRATQEVQRYSAGPVAFLAAPAHDPLWGSVSAPLRKHLSSPDESVFFPGVVILALALFGLVSARGSPYPRGLRLGLGAGALICAVLALGFGLGGAGYPYRLVYDLAPGWTAVRVPGRIFTMTTLCLALLAGAGAQLAYRWVAARGGERPVSSDRRTPMSAAAAPRSGAILATLLACALLAAVMLEGARSLPEHVVPRPARAELQLPAPLLDLPTDSPADRLWQYFSTNGFYAIPMGDSTFDIPAIDDLRGGMSSFPDLASVEKLRWYGIRTVVLHTAMPVLPGLGTSGPEPPDPAATALKPVAGLGVTRERVGSLVIYRIGPGPKALHVTR
jgi:hypothetical protein